MNRIMKALAIAALLATVLAAGVVLYGINTLAPRVVQVQSAAVPAAEEQGLFDAAMAQVRNRTFIGRVFSDAQELAAQDCTFFEYRVRLDNRGFFPAEWITLLVEPQEDESGRDVLQLDDGGAHVLNAFSQGDLTATVLREGGAPDAPRTLRVVCYVLGREIEFAMQAE